MTEGSKALGATWLEVVAELTQASADPASEIPQLSHRQLANLNLIKPVALVEGIAVLSTPHEAAKKTVEQDLAPYINRVLSAKMGRPFGIAVTVDTQAASEPPATPTQISAPAITPEPVAVEQPPAQPEPKAPEPGWFTSHVEEPEKLRPRETPAHDPNDLALLNPNYTFENYVVSDSNRLAFSAANAVAEQPAQSYNPLFIWGGSGLGKTHLMHAIGNYAQLLNQNLKIKYVSSEEFTNDYINSVRDDRQESFKRRYRSVDILMLDDIQFLQGKEGTQEEFFHTFNALEQASKQIVLSSDRPPKQLTTLEDRLRTRFQAGLIVDVYPPDLETRIAILEKKAAASGVTMRRDVLELIASRFNTSIRELEGAFVRINAYSSINNEPITMDTVEHALRSIMPEQESVEVTADRIIEETSKMFNVPERDIRGSRKTRAVAHTRQLAMYLCRELTDLSLPKIGEQFGGKDHTTVLYAVDKIRKEITQKRDTYDEIQKLTARIKGNGHA
ncbi:MULTISPECIES: chromosomal replication initiator protein DnaA [Corynebacterium]|uniref:Chromosomal replication initiator protein DnaA n=2 Tax=Corynebacterium TaxID=1716 RepID=A0A3G6IRG1_9CORY|nr:MULTISPECIES: chromosomal replication initiator protein DnaA [Corynebacterium]AZA08155.1 Chromosomal replication initiator protein DnaA [Corynebacterium pseudopelargi]QAU51308.1 Chromosomal replication initiator protein DnaA [Corynebacterium pelargi]GGG81837.1 chromosomal replication initiator protein DnaA [Corynebacterium pelargi]